ARVKITTLFNQNDRYDRSIYAVSEDGLTSEESSEAFQPIADEEIMPRGEYGGDSEDEEAVNKGAELFGFGWKTPRKKTTLRTPLKTPTSALKQRINKTPNKTPLKTPDKGRKIVSAQTPQTVRRQLRNSKFLF
ncbi:Insect origin recognition complex subunit, partial [Daphnia magna]